MIKDCFCYAFAKADSQQPNRSIFNKNNKLPLTAFKATHEITTDTTNVHRLL